MHRRYKIERAFSVAILSCCPIFLKVYRANAVTLTGVTSAQELSYTDVHSIYDLKSQKDERYTLDGKVVIPKLQILPSIAAEQQQDLFEKFYKNWDIVYAKSLHGTQSLKGKFNVAAYEPCATINNSSSIVCDAGVNSDLRQAIGINIEGSPQFSSIFAGALLGLKFDPDPGEPSGEKVRYIQFVSSSYLTCDFSGIGKGELGDFRIDNLCDPAQPFYSLPNSSAAFLDRPANFKDRDSYFIANTFLATQGNGNKATIYDGLTWWWSNTVKSTPNNAPLLSSLPPGPPAPPKLAECDPYWGYPYWGYGYWCNLPVQAAVAVQENPNFTTDPSQQLPLSASQNIESVPTPALLPTLVATGIYHGRKWRKRKNQNPDNIAA